jgi:hypothetical protein
MEIDEAESEKLRVLSIVMVLQSGSGEWDVWSSAFPLKLRKLAWSLIPVDQCWTPGATVHMRHRRCL